MKKSLFKDYQGPILDKKVQLQRVRNVIDNELTPRQRETVIAYFFEEKNIPQIAAEHGVHKSSVSRCLNRALNRIHLLLRY